jgi:hypothetical protein
MYIYYTYSCNGLLIMENFTYIRMIVQIFYFLMILVPESYQNFELSLVIEGYSLHS